MRVRIDAHTIRRAVARGAYMLADAKSGKPSVILIGTGSEVALCVDAYEVLMREGIAARVVSMPSWELFEQQDQTYRDSILPPEVTARVSVEQASVIGWGPLRRREWRQDRHAHLWFISSAQGLAHKVRIHTGQSGCGSQIFRSRNRKGSIHNLQVGQGRWIEARNRGSRRGRCDHRDMQCNSLRVVRRQGTAVCRTFAHRGFGMFVRQRGFSLK